MEIKKIIFIIFLVLVQVKSFGQQLGLYINPGDFSNSKRISTIFKEKPVSIMLFPSSGLDTLILNIENGELLKQTNESINIKPTKSDTLTINFQAFFKNGDSLKLTKEYLTIEYPEIELKLLEDSTLNSDFVVFQVFSKKLNEANSKFSIGYFEFEVITPEGNSVFKRGQTKTLKIKLDKSVITNKNKLIIHPIRLLWEEHNLTVFSKTKTFYFSHLK